MSELVQATIEKYTIDEALKTIKKIPFKIIMTDEGESKCSVCQHTEKGRHNICRNKVDYHKKVVWERETKESEYVLKMSWSNKHKPEETILRGKEEAGSEWFVDGYNHNQKYKHVITEVFQDDCKGTMSWDKQFEVSDHRSFFSVVSYFQQLTMGLEYGAPQVQAPMNENLSGMLKMLNRHFDVFNKDDLTKLNTVLLMQIASDSQKHGNMLNQIANKMHSAGNSLSFN